MLISPPVCSSSTPTLFEKENSALETQEQLVVVVARESCSGQKKRKEIRSTMGWRQLHQRSAVLQ